MGVVALLDADFPDRRQEQDLLAAAGHRLVEADRADVGDPTAVTGLLVMWNQVDAATLDRYPNLTVVGRFGLGLDNIDLAAAAERGIAVVNSGDYSTAEVATHTVALALAVLRDIVVNDHAVRTGQWLQPVRQERMARVGDLRVGVLGLGRIGRRVARTFADGFGCSVTGYDEMSTVDSMALANSLDELLRTSDLVTVHVPLNDTTRGLIGAPELALMPRGSYLVNAARGGVVDESALVDALTSGQLAGAGLDVFEAEPLPDGSPLRSLDTVVLSPHVGYLSPQSLRQARRQTAEDVVSVLAGRPPVHTLR